MICGKMNAKKAAMVAHLLLLSLGMVTTQAVQDELAPNSSTVVTDDPWKGECKDGIILPRWTPASNLSTGDRIARGLIYFVALGYMFVGVSIIADRFMAAIEVITSQEKEITIKRPNGETQTVVVRVWNETVANLTLMALGSSAPEILLSIIEIYGSGFEAGELGPGTIVGSAAFNLFVIIGICVYVVPPSEFKRIKHLRVFFITATWSIFAYIWLYIILKVTSPGIIDVWEGLLTFIFFPLTVLTAYIADRRLLIYKYLSKKYRMNRRGVIVEGEGDVEMSTPRGGGGGSLSTGVMVNPAMTQGSPYYLAGDNGKGTYVADGHLHGSWGGGTGGDDDLYQEEIREFEEHRKEYIQLLRELRKKNPDSDMETLEAMARDQIYSIGPKSRAFYRIQATRMMTGGGNVLKKRQEHKDSLISPDSNLKMILPRDDTMTTRIYFDPDHYTVMESVGEFSVTVTRQGGDLSQTVYVDYQTEDGTANAGSDYMPAAGTLLFRPGEVHKQFQLMVIDDDVFEEDEHFYVRLHNLRVGTADGRVMHVANGSPSPTTNASSQQLPVHLLSPSLATVMILDDDHAGIFSLSDKECEVPESIGHMQVRVTRFSGARGRVAVPYRTVDGTAKAGKDYEETHGYVVFEDNETEKFFVVHIAEEDSYEKDAIFVIELGEPKQLKDGESEWSPDVTLDGHHQSHLTEDQRIALMGKPRLGEITKMQVRIKESKEFKNTVDKLVKMANVSLMVGTSSWKEQFIEAITVSPGDENDDNNGETSAEKMPSCGDYVMHFLTIFWKILFAFVPPTDYWDGWLCFIVSILGIGLLTAIIGDLASHFGCTVGLKDTVTAISFVALGTSIPDTFASKVAALNDKYADSSIGNVTGSNAVNVFLGLGIAWSMAAIYHAYKGSTFHVPPGSLAFSVTLFCSLAVVAIFILMLRRSKRCGGELGGPAKYKTPTVIIFFSFWIFYVFVSGLEAYDYIDGF